MRRREQLCTLRERARATRSGRLTLKLIIGLIGSMVVAGGIVLIPLPGPGWLIVLAGLAILSVEFDWARRLLAYTRERLERWWHWLGRQHWSVRMLAGLIGLVFVGTMLFVTITLSPWFP